METCPSPFRCHRGTTVLLRSQATTVKKSDKSSYDDQNIVSIQEKLIKAQDLAAIHRRLKGRCKSTVEASKLVAIWLYKLQELEE